MAGTLTKRWPNRFIFRHHHRKSQQKTHSNELNTPCRNWIPPVGPTKKCRRPPRTAEDRLTAEAWFGPENVCFCVYPPVHVWKDPGQNGHTPKWPHPKRPQNFLLPKRPQRKDHYQNGHIAFGQNGHRGRITTKTATLHSVKSHGGTFTTKTATL